MAQFLTAGEAWQLVRSGHEDPEDFGVFGTENWGPVEIRGNAMRDLASLVFKIEMLPCDEWGPTWTELERVWSPLIQRASRLTETQRCQSVDGEWSIKVDVRSLER